ncbi:MAG: amidohydrolase family protein [Reyranella sp.]|uniref:amidohydrolase family protein n=1 Tax=Reyranella sp. TaxID=1929291 RepID=UPI00273097AE|nr:amidohydrolase family protein [Reyranella sp.]MDP1966954.1 amidohydrolase family protein [Reyranella sp.]MDP2373506.1 amidohydrolase family protein [Reyranella sp.]
MLIANALLADGTKRHIDVAGGRIAALLPASASLPARDDILDVAGGLLLPPLVDGHIHLDKTLLGLPWIPNQAAGNRVADRIEAERKVRAARTVPEAETGSNLVRQVVASGTLHMRSHVDIDNQLGLRNLHEVLKIRERFQGLVTIEIVAFPQSGILRSPGTAELLDAAVAEGADLVGGLDPVGIDGDLDGHLDAVFGIAEQRGVGVDIHLHDGGDGGIAQLLAIAERTIATGLAGRVAVSHAFALGSVDAEKAARTAGVLAKAGVAIMSHGPGGAPIPPLALLHQHGVKVFGGSDNIRDAWSPFGNGDMLERAMMIGYRANFRHDHELQFAFEMVTDAAARVLGIEAYGIAVGAAADFVIVDAGSVAEAVATRPRRKLVIKSGRVVAKDGVFVA